VADKLTPDLLRSLAADYRGLSDPQGTLEFVGEALLLALGEDPDRPGLQDTPARFARAWLEFLTPQTASLDTTFEAVSADQLIVLGPHRVWSMCEHHLLPFWCDLTLGYLPGDTIVGASKLARIADAHAACLQVQERLVNDIAHTLARVTANDAFPNPHVAVLGRGHHLCMMMRGAHCDAPFVTSAMFGHFRDKPELRAEFFTLANGHV
jgi:GTP cyclohydrolase I